MGFSLDAAARRITARNYALTLFSGHRFGFKAERPDRDENKLSCGIGPILSSQNCLTP
jgi:hypothetical protein